MFLKNHLIKLFVQVFLLNILIGCRIKAEKSDDDNAVMKLLRSKELAEIIKKDQFFQDIFTEQLEPFKIQFGHVCENPNEWEQRFEEKDFAGNQHRGKVKWGNKNGGYGEQYWDLNH